MSEEALRKYGRHLPGCSSLVPGSFSAAGGCSCGLSAALLAAASRDFASRSQEWRPITQAEELSWRESSWLARLAEWDAGRVWLDGAWWEVDGYGAEVDGVCSDVVMHRMDPQPEPIDSPASRSEERPGLTEKDKIRIADIEAWQIDLCNDGSCSGCRFLLGLIDRLASRDRQAEGLSDG